MSTEDPGLSSEKTSAPAGAAGVVAADAPPLRAVIKNVDMTAEMQTSAIALAQEALRTFTLEKDMAAFTKKRLDVLFGPTWQSVVGRSFGSYCTHEVRHFIYFYLGDYAFLFWRA